jgi:hypothetical protein
MMNRFTLPAILLAAAAVQARQDRAPLQPKVNDVTLTGSGRTLKPVRVHDTWTSAKRFGDLEIQLGQTSAKAVDAATGKPAWEAVFKDEGPMRWLAADATSIYLAPQKSEEPPVTVRRLEAATGKWLDPIVIPPGEQKEKTAEWAGGLILLEGGALVLAVTLVDDPKIHDDGSLISYRVLRFGAGKPDPLWSKSFASAGSRERPGAYLFASRRPDYAVDGPVPLSLLGDRVVVCAGAKEDVVCLKLADGSESWRLPRIWEFRRGFIGPSVWSHYLGRWGLESHDFALAEKELGKARNTSLEHHKAVKEMVAKVKARYENERGFIVAGPVAVPGKKTSLFVVAGRSEPSPWAGYLADAVLYEISEGGEPVATAILPRMVNPGQQFMDGGGVLWGCPQAAFVRVVPTHQERGFGPGERADMLCRIDWYRNPQEPEPKAWWLKADPAGDPVAWTKTHAFRLFGDAYVEKKGDKVYHFPIGRVDLATGGVDVFTLHVPFDGEVPQPKTNYRGTEEQVHTYGPYLLGITWMEIVGDTLEVVLGVPGKASSVRFRLDDLR